MKQKASRISQFRVGPLTTDARSRLVVMLLVLDSGLHIRTLKSKALNSSPPKGSTEADDN